MAKAIDKYSPWPNSNVNPKSSNTKETKEELEKEMVNHPDHYNQYPMECIDVLRVILTPEEFRGFCLGNAIKYRWRCGHKDDPAQELKKAEWYLNEFKNSKD